jgi:hypothetical protein
LRVTAWSWLGGAAALRSAAAARIVDRPAMIPGGADGPKGVSRGAGWHRFLF